VVQVPQGYVVFQLLAIRPPATPTFEEIRSKVEAQFKNERAGFLLQQKTQELSDRAKAEHDLKKAAKDLGATVKTSDLVAPDGQVPDIGSMSSASAIFSLKPGEISGPITAGAMAWSRSFSTNRRRRIRNLPPKKDEIRQSLLEAKQNDLFGLFVTNLRKDMEKTTGSRSIRKR
jgi:peptidyl-prolyl cis-trans isomerase D